MASEMDTLSLCVVARCWSNTSTAQAIAGWRPEAHLEQPNMSALCRSFMWSIRSSSDLQVLTQKGQIKEPDPALFSILTDSWRLSSILIFLQTILSRKSSSRTAFFSTRFFFKLFSNLDSSLTCSSLCSLVSSSTAIGAALAPVRREILLGGERDLFLELRLLFLLGDVSRLGENPLELDDHPPLL